ncbi:MAG: ABC transporter permease [Chloroflexota bacterium]
MAEAVLTRPATGEPKARPGAVGGRARRVAGHVLAITAAMLAWSLLSGRVLDPFFISSPIDVIQTLGEWIVTGKLWLHLSYTLYEIALGILIGGVLGLVMGFALAEFRVLGRNVEPYVMAAYGVPRTALAPLFILWFGIGVSSKVAQAALMVLFLVFFNTYAGLRNVDQELQNVVRLMGANRHQLMRMVKLPAALPFIMTGFKVGVPQSLVGAVVAEFISSNKGIGYLIVLATSQFDIAGTFAGILVLMVVVYVLNVLLEAIDRATDYRRRAA